MRSTKMTTLVALSVLSLGLAACGDSSDSDSSAGSDSGSSGGLGEWAGGSSEDAPADDEDGETDGQPAGEPDNESETELETETEGEEEIESQVANSPDDMDKYYPDFNPIESLSPTSDPVISERGGIVKEFGELAGVRNNDTGNLDVRFRVLDIQPRFECFGEQAIEPSSGAFIVVTFEVLAEPTLAEAIDPFFSVTVADLALVDDSGVVYDNLDADIKTCLNPDDYMNGPAEPGDHRVSNIVIDAPLEHGTLIVTSPTVDGSWEWNF